MTISQDQISKNNRRQTLEHPFSNESFRKILLPAFEVSWEMKDPQVTPITEKLLKMQLI